MFWFLIVFFYFRLGLDASLPFPEITMLTPPSVVLPAQPTKDEVLHWMENNGFAPYKDALEDAFSTSHFTTPEDIRSASARILKDRLGFPNYGLALEFRWFLTEGNLQRLDSGLAPLAAMDELDTSRWLESLDFTDCAIRFLDEGITGKGAEVVQLPDMLEMGFEDSQFCYPFLEVRDKMMMQPLRSKLHRSRLMSVLHLQLLLQSRVLQLQDRLLRCYMPKPQPQHRRLQIGQLL